MKLAAIDMSPSIGVTIGVVLALASGWYWHHLGREHVERSTRALRRASLVLGLFTVFALVRAACFIDSEVNPSGYITAWLTALGLLFLVVLVIACDVINNFRLHRVYLEQEAMETASRLSVELKEYKASSGDQSEKRG